METIQGQAFFHHKMGPMATQDFTVTKLAILHLLDTVVEGYLGFFMSVIATQTVLQCVMLQNTALIALYKTQLLISISCAWK